MKQENAGQKKEKDYKKISGIKSAVFLILAVLVLAGMFLQKKETADPIPSSAELQLPVTADAKQEWQTQSVQTQSPGTEASTQELQTQTSSQELQTQTSSQELQTQTSSQELQTQTSTQELQTQASSELTVNEQEEYSDKEHVALYLHKYQKLPSNYITKTKAKKRGWDQKSGNLWEVCPGMSIGGGTFNNEEKKLPEKEGRSWKECDIDYGGGNRNGKRLVWSDDGLIYYTEDHYETFECIYGEEP